jgi:xanthine dehydrogenase molybdopterin-binding subunit B
MTDHANFSPVHKSIAAGRSISTWKARSPWRSRARTATCWSSSTQHPTEVQHLVAKVLKLSRPCGHRAETRRMGGGFGGKESQASLIAVVAALLARKTGGR